MDWEAIRAEYVDGSDSYASLSQRHGVRLGELSQKARDGGWVEQRRQKKRDGAMGGFAKSDGGEAPTAAARQWPAPEEVDEDEIVAGIRRKALLILDRMFDDYAEVSATEQRFSAGGVTNVRKLRDMTAVLKELTGGLARDDGADVEDLDVLAELLREDE